MNNIFKKICIVMMVAGFGFQAHAGDRNEAEVAARINAQNAKFMVAFNSGDAAGMAALYTSDAIFMPNNGPRAVGREAIEAAAASFFTGPKLTFKLETDSVKLNGHLANEVGRWTMIVTPEEGEPMSSNGDYLVVWKKQKNGDWLLHIDIFNGNGPPAQ